MASDEFSDTVVVVLAVGEYPTVRGHWGVPLLCPIHIVGGVACNPTLEVVAVVSGEYLTCSEIISEMHR